MEMKGFQAGMNNKANDTSLPEGTARNIVNMDVDNAGKLHRRKGVTKVVSGLNLRASFSCDLGLFLVDDTTLLQVDSDNNTTTLFSGITGDTIAWDYFNGVVRLSDGNICKKITSSGISDWGIDVPARPSLSQASGSLTAGQYLAAIVLVDSDNVESGASPVRAITMSSDNVGITFKNLPQYTDYVTRLYLSTVNGSVLYHVADTSDTTYTVSEEGYDNSNTLEMLDVTKPPAGNIIKQYSGRMYVIAGSTAWYSEPYQPDHFKISDNYLLFPSDITLFQPVSGGIFVATDSQTWFYQGIPEDGFTMLSVLDYGAIKGKSHLDDQDRAVWQSTQGTCIGTPDGQVQNLQLPNIAAGTGDSVASIIRQSDGFTQFIASIKNSTDSNLAASSWIEAEVTRRNS